MDHLVIRYTTKPDRAAENRAAIENVFAELQRVRPADVAYLALELEDGTFIHIATGEHASLTGLDAFQAFSAGVRDRVAEGPVRKNARVVGSWRMLGSGAN